MVNGGVGGTTNMLIRGNGRVGFGRTPSFRVDVAADGTSSYQTLARFGDSGNDILITHTSAYITHNAYYDGNNGGWRVTAEGASSGILMQGGVFNVVTTNGTNTDTLSFGKNPLTISNDGAVAINQSTTDSNYALKVNGTFAATSKSFVIDHPTKENYQLVYGSLEGPEHGVYVRGKASDVIELPDYWTALVDENTITVQLTPIGDHHAWVEKIEDNKVFIGGGAAFYFVQAERKDVNKLQVEVQINSNEEEVQ